MQSALICGRLQINADCMISGSEREGARGGVEGLAGVDEVDDEDQRLPRPDGAARAAVAVAEPRRDDDAPASADLHALDPLVPPGDHLTGAESEVQGLAAVPGGVELLPRRVRDTHVVRPDRHAGLRLRAVADDLVDHLQVLGRGAVGEVDLGALPLGLGHRVLLLVGLVRVWWVSGSESGRWSWWSRSRRLARSGGRGQPASRMST